MLHTARARQLLRPLIFHLVKSFHEDINLIIYEMIISLII